MNNHGISYKFFKARLEKTRNAKRNENQDCKLIRAYNIPLHIHRVDKNGQRSPVL